MLPCAEKNNIVIIDDGVKAIGDNTGRPKVPDQESGTTDGVPKIKLEGQRTSCY